MQRYNWTRILLFTLDENHSKEVHEHCSYKYQLSSSSSFNKILHVHFDYNVIQIDALLRQALRRANITVSSRIIRTGEDPTTIDDLFVSAHTVINLYML